MLPGVCIPSSRKRRVEVTAVALLRVHLFFVFLFFFDVDLRSRGMIAFAIKRLGDHSLNTFLRGFTMLVAISNDLHR